jgi:hypothetical protein
MHELIHASFVDTHAAVYPVDLAAVPSGHSQQGGDLILRGGVVLFGNVLAVNGVRVRRLVYERERRSTFVRKQLMS